MINREGQKDCKRDTVPRTRLFAAENDSEDLVVFDIYRIDSTAKNFIEITKFDTLNNDIQGNFQVTFTQQFKSTNPEVPNNPVIRCSSFKIPWGKKRGG
ncbi:MAG: hypothetical protein HC817_06420 [Saprospiraceae bacterium]|nr:hypothetical protein [Saprospiraceae bacterium]